MPATLTCDPIASIQEALRSGRLTLNSLELEGGVAVDFERENFVTLNATATTILEALSSGATDTVTIAELVCDRFDVSPDVARKSVDEFVQQFAGYLLARR